MSSLRVTLILIANAGIAFGYAMTAKGFAMLIGLFFVDFLDKTQTFWFETITSAIALITGLVAFAAVIRSDMKANLYRGGSPDNPPS
jgi:uncharacterized membrane protein